MVKLIELSPGKREFLLRKLWGQIKKGEIPETPELHRIRILPRRVWETDEIDDIGTVDVLVEMLTEFLKIAEGAQTLRPVQAKSLQEAHDFGGLFGPIPVGDGKTLISFLAPVVLEADRPLLVVPARLKRKTTHEFSELEEHWQKSENLKIVSYEKLSREGGTPFLEESRPDLLILDEVHRLKNRRAAVTRRFREWMKEHPETKVIAMSGTITKRSLLDFAHILRWCLPPGLQPLPINSRELEAWAGAVDVIRRFDNHKKMDGVSKRTRPGALRLLLNDEEKKQKITGVRAGVRRRIQETPGVVASVAQEVAASLNIVLTLVDGYSERIHELADGLNKKVKPNGDTITDEDLSTRWRIVRTLRNIWAERSSNALEQRLCEFKKRRLARLRGPAPCRRGAL